MALLFLWKKTGWNSFLHIRGGGEMIEHVSFSGTTFDVLL